MLSLLYLCCIFLSSFSWLLLHRRTKDKKIVDIIVTNGIPTERIVTLLLNTAQLEYKLKSTLNGIMETKEARWGECRTQVVERLTELSKYFTGQMVSDFFFFFPPLFFFFFPLYFTYFFFFLWSQCVHPVHSEEEK